MARRGRGVTPDERQALEQQIRAAHDAGDRQQAATLLLEGYGAEILGFLISRARDREAASEIFSRFSEDLWSGLPGFRWQCSARVWSYTLARHAASHYGREAQRRRGRQVPLSHAGPISEVADRIRTATLASARTDAKNRIVRLRERLPLDDQTLLILRINRQLAWVEIAQVMFHKGETVDAEVLEREAIRLRKRYQAAKEKLRKLAVAEGVLDADDEG
jgi:RNA polymerase sigma-70 factor (ECF subfamily)